MTDITTEAVERLMKDVTPGPWTVRSGLSITAPDVDCPSDPWLVAGVASMCGWPVQTHYNAAFIAASRDLVPALLADRDRLTALLAASQSPDPVTNADSRQPFPKPQRNDGGQPCGECRLPDGEVCDICGASNQLTQPTRTYEDGVRDAARLAKFDALMPEVIAALDASMFNLSLTDDLRAIIKEKSHE